MKENLYKCTKCYDTGWITKYRDDGSRYVVSCECRDKEIIRNQWIGLGININNSKQSFQNFEVWNEKANIAKKTTIAYYKRFEDIKEERQNSIILCGQVGSGKTHLAVALALNFISKNIKVMYMPYRDSVTEIKLNMTQEGKYFRLMDKYKKSDVLLIDDLFKGKINESDINIMFEIINYRYINHMPIIITSEFSIKRLLDFDEGIGSRIYEMCKSCVVEVPKNGAYNYRTRGLNDRKGRDLS